MQALPLVLRAYSTPANTTVTAGGGTTVPLTAPNPAWPKLNGNTVDGTPVSYIWNVDPLTTTETASGQLVTFTTTVTIPALAVANATVVVTVFADNAVSSSLFVGGVPVPLSPTNPLTNGGPVTPSGSNDTPPWFWSNVGVGVAELTLAIGVPTTLTLSSTVANYATPGLGPDRNPAGYLAEIQVYGTLAI